MKTRNVTAGLLALLFTMMLTGCYKAWHHVEGNYDVQSETRTLPDFEKVFNEENFDVYIIQDGLSEVEIEAESNLIPLIRTRLEGSALVIDTRDHLRNNYPMKIYVHTSEVSELRISGSGLMEAENILASDLSLILSGSGDMFFSGNCHDVECKISGSGSVDLGIMCDVVEADISGSGEVEIWGESSFGDFSISGSGSIRAYELLLKECQAKISGSGSMYLTVEDYLYVDISGSGSVFYLGTPEVDTRITGSGTVTHP